MRGGNMSVFLSALLELVQNLPAILQLIKKLQANIAKAAEDRKVSDDLAKIHEAFEKNDASILNDIFRS